MSDLLDRNEREKRALEALIISTLLRERDISDLDDLPQLSESQRSKLNGVPANLVDQLWNSKDEEISLKEFEVAYEESFQELEFFAGANRAEEMDKETLKKLEEARKLARERMRKNKGKGDAQS